MSGYFDNNIIIDCFRFKVIQMVKTIEVSDISQEKKSRLEIIKNKVFFEKSGLNDLCYAEKDLIEMCTEEQLDILYREERCKYSKILPIESKSNIQYLDDYVVRHLAPAHVSVEKTAALEKDKNKKSKLLCVCGWIHEYYYFLIEKERFIKKVKRDLFLMLLVLICLSLLYHMAVSSINDNSNIKLKYSLILEMASAGYFGAVISTVRRFQNMAIISADGIDREGFLLKLQQGVWGIYLSVLLGATSPFVLFLLLNIISPAGTIKIISVDVLPHFNVSDDKMNVTGLFESGRLSTVLDIAKMLLLSVFCGFSERLVPDVLDRMDNEIHQSNLFKIQETLKDSEK